MNGLRLTLAVLQVLCFTVNLVAQDSDVTSQRRERMRKLATSYEVFVDVDGKQLADFLPDPIFSWANPERSAIAGDLYLWIHAGRPHATIGIWTYDDIADSHEVQSLAGAPFHARGQRYPDWNPQVASVEYRPIVGEDNVSKSATVRLTQMRQIAKTHFSANMTKADGQEIQLRLLPQPIYRYRETPTQVIDGAMFSFAVGTDPEVFLIIEAREEQQSTQYYYAFAPSTSANVEGKLNGSSIWNNRADKQNGNFRMRLENFPQN